ncbi:hypothetical protein AVAK2825_11665 [Acidovorax sp. SUPP2825]|nr:hypothetical protein AVAK2825_11665 [Acidovorax sp. SUPP2825]
MSKSNKCSPEVRERAVTMVQEHRGEYSSLWAAIESIAPKMGSVPQTLHEWVKRVEVDTGETINGLYKAKLIHRRAPWKTKEAVELATLEWCRGSTTIACSNPSGISRQQKPRQTTTCNPSARPPQWRPQLNQTASENPGSI